MTSKIKKSGGLNKSQLINVVYVLLKEYLKFC